MRILLLGSSGYVGSWIRSYFTEKRHEVVGVKCDITDPSSLQEELRRVGKADVLINAAGKTGVPNVDWCEDHKLETYKVNVEGAVNVAEACKALGIYMVQIGSGCIFSGDDSYSFTEEDQPNFFGSFYSQTKAVCESVLREFDNVCVLRIRMPIQGSSCTKNLLNKILKYEKIISLPNSVTIMEDFMLFVEQVCEQRITGVLNAVNPGVYEHKMILELYREIVDPSRSFEYIGLDEFTGMVKAARSNCVLSTVKCEELGIAMPAVNEDRLRKLLESYKDSL
jgi:dTDP-4-dehydrorhamnose reductase